MRTALAAPLPFGVHGRLLPAAAARRRMPPSTGRRPRGRNAAGGGPPVAPLPSGVRLRLPPPLRRRERCRRLPPTARSEATMEREDWRMRRGPEERDEEGIGGGEDKEEWRMRGAGGEDKEIRKRESERCR